MGFVWTVYMMGAGSARPVVSRRMAWKSFRRDASWPRVRTRSPRTEQQTAPLALAVVCGVNGPSTSDTEGGGRREGRRGWSATDKEGGKKKRHNLELVQSVGIRFDGELHAQYFNVFMMDLLRTRAADMYRTKGLLSFHGQGDTKFVFQGVHEQINFGPAKKPWVAGERRENKFVFIGRNLDRKELTEGLMECLYKEDDVDK